MLQLDFSRVPACCAQVTEGRIVLLKHSRPLPRQCVSTKTFYPDFFLVSVVYFFPLFAKETAELHSRRNECADCASFFFLFLARRFIPNRDPRRLSNESGTRRDVRDRRKPRWVAQDWEGDCEEWKGGQTDGSTKKRVSGRPTFLNRRRPGLVR